MPSVGNFVISAVEKGISITVGMQQQVLTVEEAINFAKILNDLIPRVDDILRDKLQARLMTLETEANEIKEKLSTLERPKLRIINAKVTQ